jgi:LMBR1 domain-containing protein 1
MAASVWLIIAASVLSVIVLIASALILIAFSHPDDKNSAWIPKLVVLLGLFMAATTVLAMPFDVANSQGNGGLDLAPMWQSIFIIDAIFLVLVLPFAFFYYESDYDRDLTSSEERKVMQHQACTALKYTLISSTIFILIVLIMYFFFNTAEIPVTAIVQTDAKWGEAVVNNVLSETICPAANCRKGSFTWSIPLSFPIYLIAILSFVGWFLFAIFVGVGIIALPADLVNAYLTRPTPISKKDYALKRVELGKRAQELKNIAKEFLGETTDVHHKADKKTKKMDRQTQNRLENAVWQLKNEYKAAQVAFVERGGNPIWYWFQLFLGIISAGISLSWVLHICIFMLPRFPPTAFLNSLFIELTIPGFPLFGVFAFTFYTFYLLWAAVKGNLRLGLRIPFLIKVFPMELNNTMMNAMLFNVWMILIVAIPTLQFSAQAFPIYARFTQVDVIFGNQIQYLKFFTYFFSTSAFIFAMLAIIGLTAAVSAMCPRDRSLEVDRKIKRIAEGKEDDDDD